MAVDPYTAMMAAQMGMGLMKSKKDEENARKEREIMAARERVAPMTGARPLGMPRNSNPYDPLMQAGVSAAMMAQAKATADAGKPDKYDSDPYVRESMRQPQSGGVQSVPDYFQNPYDQNPSGIDPVTGQQQIPPALALTPEHGITEEAGKSVVTSGSGAAGGGGYQPEGAPTPTPTPTDSAPDTFRIATEEDPKTGKTLYLKKYKSGTIEEITKDEYDAYAH